ncbi:porin family protein [Phenylobacterium sp.]|uniref:porin family protein n=1 Tax=Phenylobacterium sp. TaxID=1871053 RepID=UPI0027357C1C|nr:porin family protein [Phenylobacterium sp.]MDP3658919.1 porin family protein [Phenylobacterium sp.]
MNKLTLIAAAASAVLVTATPLMASAQDSGPQIYGTLGYAHTDVEGADLGAIQGRVGARFGSYLGVEGELAGGVKEDDVTVAGTPVNVKLQSQVAVYGVASVPVTPSADLFARVGYGTSKIKGQVGGVSATVDGDSWNYGVGGQYFFDGANGVRADYTRHDFKDDGDADVWSLAYVRKF